MESAALADSATAAMMAVAASSFVVSWLCYFGSRSFSSALFKVYRAMPPDEKAAWDTRVVSSIHALVSFVGAVWSMVRVASLVAEVGPEAAFIRGANMLIETFFAISIGYFLQDFLVIVIVRGALWSLPDLVHHTIAVAGLVVCLSTQTFLFYTMWAMLGEISTPLLNLRYICSKLGVTVPAIDYLFVASFFTSRPVNMVINLGHALRYYSSWSHLSAANLQFGIGLAFAALQFYWGYLIVRAIIDTLWPPAPAGPGAAKHANAQDAAATATLVAATQFDPKLD